MALTERLTRFLDEQKVWYETLPHRDAFTAAEVAAVSHVPGLHLGKVVVVREAGGGHPMGGYLMAVLPAPCRLDLDALEAATRKRRLALATESEVAGLFPDCEVGAMPPFGHLYGLPVYVDACFPKREEFVFQGGNHHEVVRMRYGDFERLAGPASAEFCLHAREKVVNG